MTENTLWQSPVGTVHRDSDLLSGLRIRVFTLTKLSWTCLYRPAEQKTEGQERWTHFHRNLMRTNLRIRMTHVKQVTLFRLVLMLSYLQIYLTFFTDLELQLLPAGECSHATAAPTHSHSTWCFFNRKPRWRAILMTGWCCYLSSNLRRTLNLYIPFVLQLIYSLFGWLPSARLLLPHYQFPHLFLFHTIPLWLWVLLSWESRSGSYYSVTLYKKIYKWKMLEWFIFLFLLIGFTVTELRSDSATETIYYYS